MQAVNLFLLQLLFILFLEKANGMPRRQPRESEAHDHLHVQRAKRKPLMEKNTGANDHKHQTPQSSDSSDKPNEGSGLQYVDDEDMRIVHHRHSTHKSDPYHEKGHPRDVDHVDIHIDIHHPTESDDNWVHSGNGEVHKKESEEGSSKPSHTKEHVEEEHANTSGQENVESKVDSHTVKAANHKHSSDGDDEDHVDDEDIHVHHHNELIQGEDDEGHSGDGENSGQGEDEELDLRWYGNTESGSDVSRHLPLQEETNSGSKTLLVKDLQKKKTETLRLYRHNSEKSKKHFGHSRHNEEALALAYSHLLGEHAKKHLSHTLGKKTQRHTGHKMRVTVYHHGMEMKDHFVMQHKRKNIKFSSEIDKNPKPSLKLDAEKERTRNRSSTDKDIFIEEATSKPNEYEVEIRKSSGDYENGNENQEEGLNRDSRLDQYAKVSGNKMIHGGRQTRKLLSVTEDPERKRDDTFGMLSEESSDKDEEFEEVESQNGYNQIFRSKGAVLQCHHTDLTKAVNNGSLVYLRLSCRVCLCLSGRLQCEPKPAICPNSKASSSQPCQLQNEQVVPHGSFHHDGCNCCRCRNGNLLCTRIRCRNIGLRYTNYNASDAKEENRLEAIGLKEGTKSERWRDACLECDFEPMAPVCGPNWKTYRTLCHAQLCGGFEIKDIEMRPCEELRPCQHHFCSEGTVCVDHRRGPCLASKTREGKIIECRQYKCVPKEVKCDMEKDGPEHIVCGEDGITYPNECAMHHWKAGVPVSLAYRGSCKLPCSPTDKSSAKVCGVDSTFKSSTCEARMLNSHIDYRGECEATHARPILVPDKDRPDHLVNTVCLRIREKSRCPEPECDQTVVPEGSCCPVCGASLSIRLDTSVQDIADVHVLSYDPDLNTPKIILDGVRTFQENDILSKCEITADLTDTNDVSVVFTPIKPQFLENCEDAARRTHRTINSQREVDDLAPNLMAAAALVQSEDLVSSDGRARVRRSNHHEHEQIYSNSSAVYIHGVHSATLITRVLPWWMVYFLSN